MRGGGRIAYAAPGDVICSYAANLETASIGDDGTLYSIDTNGVLYAINPDCTLKWQYQASGQTLTSPAISDDGTIYFVGKDSFYAVNPNGTLKWQQQAVKSTVYQLPAIDGDGIIYVGDSQGILYALNPSDGSIRWQYSTGDPSTSAIVGSPVIASDSTLYISAGTKGLFAINPNGSLKWQYSSSCTINSVPAVGNDGMVYAGGYVSLSAASILALTPSGTLKWQHDAPSLMGVSPAVSIGSDGTIYYGGSSQAIAMTPDGKLKWAYAGEIIGGIGSRLLSFAVATNGTIYTYKNNGTILRILNAINSADGTLKWKASVGSGTGWTSVPAIATDGTIYVGLSGDQKLYAVQGDSPWTYADYLNSMKGYADSPWPRFKQNNFNTGHRPKPILSLPDVKICAGTSTVSVPITLNNVAASGIEGIELKITFDNTILTYTDATLSGSILDGKNYLLQKNLVGNEIHLAIYAASSLFNGSGIIGYLNFNIGTGKSDLKFTMSELNAKSVLAQSGSVSTDGGYTVSGHIGYYFNGNPVRDTHLKLTGPKTFESNPNSGNDGNYTVTTDCTSGTYTLKASKTTDLGGVSGTDASDIGRHIVGKVVFNCHQKIAADADQDGKLTPVDASRVARHAADPTFCMNTSCVNWAFTPNPITSCPNWPLISYTKDRSVTLPPDATGQDFVAIRLGDVTGNWAPTTTTRSVRNHIGTRDNPTYTLTTQPGFACKVPIILSQSSEIRGIDVTVEFDKAVVSASDVTLSGGILDGKGYFVSAINTGVAGEVSFSIYASNDLFTGNGVVAYISFTPVSATQTDTTLTLTKFDVNETAVSGAFGNAVCNAYDPYICDFDGNQKRGLPEVIYGLQCIAEVRQNCTCETDLAKVIRTLRVLTGL